jgi:hypothetical protein
MANNIPDDNKIEPYVITPSIWSEGAGVITVIRIRYDEHVNQSIVDAHGDGAPARSCCE